MSKATAFNFKGYTYEPDCLKITFDYSIEFSDRAPLSFSETILLPKTPRKISPEVLEKFLDPLSLILGISYYKLYCPPKIATAFPLSEKQAEFWNTVYRKGLGEFLYRNNLDPKKVARFPFSKKVKASPVSVSTSEKILLGIGGGKDSIVATELLRDFDVASYLLETQKGDPIAEQVIDIIGNPSLKIRRILDPQIFEEHAGAYNGHIPISAIFAFTGLLSSALYGYKYVVVGNEHSSNFGNAEYKGETINHQWSKSAEFEAMLQEYTRGNITTDIQYFSLLRQFYEIRVAKLFSRYPKYFETFSSCNRNFKVFKDRPDTLWCGECPKCAFVFLILSPFIPKTELVKIFGKNLLADESLIPLFGDILGFGSMKPFECVGTFEESRASLYLSANSYKSDIVTKKYLKKIKNPETLIETVMQTTHAPTLPTPFKFLGIETVGILGYRREGKVTEKYLKKFYPKLKIGILDEDRDKNYLAKQKNFDLIIKTPGIPKEKVTGAYTTATNVFFSQNKNLTVGITGTKGKSTTTTLVYEMLKAGGKKVRLLGNIGNPMLEALLRKIDKKEVFVIELSSYMLDDIEYSPNISLLINLFPEHMNYHTSLPAYYEAKMNIFKYQKAGDIKILPPFTAKIPTKEIPLLGEHNKMNIRASVAVARALGIKDSAIAKAIKNFRPLPHRLELIGTHNGITFYDDAISTTPQSAIAAIKTLKNIGTLFLGGEDRGYDFTDLEKTVRKYKIKNIVLFPTSGSRMLKNKKGLNILETRSMKQAVAFAYKNTPRGSICLLSTASPSYSVWKNFEEKGNEFKKYVKKAKQ
ncbi:MAG: hypothetical protein KBC17_01170 [Candidatus Pacebacteria bacterium]|nr:hypothetical protein [Candidatus Paceibacterota bacterium]